MKYQVTITNVCDARADWAAVNNIVDAFCNGPVNFSEKVCVADNVVICEIITLEDALELVNEILNSRDVGIAVTIKSID